MAEEQKIEIDCGDLSSIHAEDGEMTLKGSFQPTLRKSFINTPISGSEAPEDPADMNAFDKMWEKIYGDIVD